MVVQRLCGGLSGLVTIEVPVDHVWGAPVSALRFAPDDDGTYELVVASGFSTVVECGGVTQQLPEELVAAAHGGGLCLDRTDTSSSPGLVVFVDRARPGIVEWHVSVRSIRALTFG